MPGESTHVDPEGATPREPAPVATPAPGPAAPRRRSLGRQAAVVVGAPLLVSAAAVTILVTRFQTSFLINDDATLASIVNGDYTGKRSSSLVVAPSMFGDIVRVGYSMFGSLPWYGITLYALQIIAWAVIGMAAFTLSRRPPVAERLVVAAIIVALVPWMILGVSFTPTSLLIGVAGIILFAVAANVPGRLGTTYAVIAGVLLGAAYLVRVYSFLGVIIVFAPVLAIIAVRAGFRRSAAFALAMGVLVLVGFGTSKIEYGRSAEWRAFTKMNTARSSLHETPRLYNQNVSQRDLDHIGWTRNDLNLFADFIYPEPRVYTDKDIRTLASESPRVRRDMSAGGIFDVLARDSAGNRAVDRAPVVAWLVGVAGVLALRRNRATALAILASAVWLVAVLIALLLYVRLPGRVLVPLEGGAVLLAAIVPAYLTPPSERTRAWPEWAPKAIIVVTAILVAVPAWNGLRSASQISRENRNGVETTQATLDRLQQFDPKGIFVARGDLLGRWVEPLSAATPFSNRRLIPLGWATNSPLFTARLARLGIDDLYTALETNPHVYFVGFPYEAQRMALYYQQHRGIKVRFVARLAYLPEYFGTVVVRVNVWSATIVHAP